MPTPTQAPDDRPKVPCMVRLDADTADRVKALAHQGDRTLSQQIRRLIAQALEQNPQGANHDMP